MLLAALNSQSVHSNPALYSLTRAAEQAGCAGDLQTRQFSTTQPRMEIIRQIYQLRPTAVAFSTYIWNIDFLAPLLGDLKALLPQSLFLLGGPEASMRARHYLSTLPVDGICVGEGEESFPALLLALARGEQQPNIPGWMWRGKEDEFIPAARPDFSSLPFLYSDTDLAELARLGRVLYYESSRGCPFSCSFCASAAEPLRERPLPLVLDELTLLAQAGGQIKFVDRTFNAAPERAVAITRRVLELHRPGLSWHFEISPYRLPQPLVELWLSAPRDYLKLEMGVQTLNPRALELVGRHGDWAEAEPIVQQLIAADRAHLHLDLIAGLPGDDPAGFAASFHRLHQLNADYLQFGFLKLLPGSLLATRAEQLGLIASPSPPYRVLATPTMDADYLAGLAQTERAFNALYNKGGPSLRPLLLELAEQQPEGALGLYRRAAQLLPPGGLNLQTKQEILTLL